MQEEVEWVYQILIDPAKPDPSEEEGTSVVSLAIPLVRYRPLRVCGFTLDFVIPTSTCGMRQESGLLQRMTPTWSESVPVGLIQTAGEKALWNTVVNYKEGFKMSGLIETVVTSMKRWPDKWTLVAEGERKKWARMKNGKRMVDVKIDGKVEIGLPIDESKDKIKYGEVPVSYWERRKLKAAVANLFREKSVRIIDRAEDKF